jgi:hypothetical protein
MPSSQYLFSYERVTSLKFPGGQTLMKLIIA